MLESLAGAASGDAPPLPPQAPMLRPPLTATAATDTGAAGVDGETAVAVGTDGGFLAMWALKAPSFCTGGSHTVGETTR